MPIPKCPIHNLEMDLKIARTGRNAGGKFWGCPTWRTTKCRETLPFEEGENDQPTERVQPNDSSGSILPRKFSARTRYEGLQARFFESVAVSEHILERMKDLELSDDYIRAFSQWRIDFPTQREEFSWEEREKQTFSVAEKIFTRGRLTLISPSLEQQFRNRFQHSENYNEILNFTPEILFPGVDYICSDYWLDSPPETIFFENYLPSKFGPNFIHWVMPQVEIISLLNQSTANSISGRVDFLICHPKIKDNIVVEIDGEDHKSHQDKDAERDVLLSREGYKVIRIPTSEIEQLEGINLSELNNLISLTDHVEIEKSLHRDALIKFIHAIKISHQIQLVILQAIKTGFLEFADASNWTISTDLSRLGLFDEGESQFILESSVNDLIIFLKNLGSLYSKPVCEGVPCFVSNSNSDAFNISFTGQSYNSYATFLVQNISVPFHITNDVFITSSAILDRPSPEVLEYFLNYIFRKTSFWEGQFEAISRTLEGQDSIVLLPTGAGKSIAFQLAALLLPGRAVIIAPIISLMDDQIDNLQCFGIDRVISITGQITDPNVRSRVLTLFGQGEFLLVYIAPERFQTLDFRESLRSLTTHTPISLIAVDEAHCVSEWGHDFRTSYLNIGRTSREYCKSNELSPPLLALTGTASRSVLKDVQRELALEDFDAIITPESFDRPELKFHIVKSNSAEKRARLLGYLGQNLPSKFASSSESFFQPNGKTTFSGLVFCPHINGEFGVVEISEKIKSSLSIQSAFYCGKKPKYYTGGRWGVTKQAVARQYKNNQVPLLVCTKAFGMGIDKPNIRYTVHYGIPSSIESFYQEAGRAGSDRRTAQCCILVSDDDPE